MEDPVLRLLKTLKLGLPHSPVNPHLGAHPKGTKSAYGRGVSSPMFAAIPVTGAKLCNQPSVHGQIKDKENVLTVCIHTAIERVALGDLN